VRDNILYGRPDATEAERCAKPRAQAKADGFIADLVDARAAAATTPMSASAG
jgi:ABC-type multidrug transport system fused ATPase/permease subunit